MQIGVKARPLAAYTTRQRASAEGTFRRITRTEGDAAPRNSGPIYPAASRYRTFHLFRQFASTTAQLAAYRTRGPAGYQPSSIAQTLRRTSKKTPPTYTWEKLLLQEHLAKPQSSHRTQPRRVTDYSLSESNKVRLSLDSLDSLERHTRHYPLEERKGRRQLKEAVVDPTYLAHIPKFDGQEIRKRGSRSTGQESTNPTKMSLNNGTNGTSKDVEQIILIDSDNESNRSVTSIKSASPVKGTSSLFPNKELSMTNVLNNPAKRARSITSYGSLAERRVTMADGIHDVTKTPDWIASIERRPSSEDIVNSKMKKQKLNPLLSSDGITKNEFRHDNSTGTPTEGSKSGDLTDKDGEKKDKKLETTKSKAKDKDVIKLSNEQNYVLDYVMNSRQSIFFTGSAGTGKSVLLSEMIKHLKNKYRGNCVAVTASTGIAACNIGGCTLHSFVGCGYGDGPVEKLIASIKRNPRVANRWRETKVLIIDEISMIDGKFLDKLEEIARVIRNNRKPFGGIQLVFCGDFLQLPPVNKDSVFAFNSAAWKKCITKTFVLTEVFRQKEQGLIDLLNDIRYGKVSPLTDKLLSKLSRPAMVPEGVEPTHLYPLRRQAEAENKARLSKLPGQTVLFKAHDSGNETHRNKLKDVLAPDLLELKVDAQVILVKNLSNVLVNGSIGKVIDFVKIDKHSEGLPLVRFSSKRYGSVEVLVEREIFNVEVPGVGVVASRSQVPLALAYALSIHKSQGQTIDFVKVDLLRVFEKGQAYVALSRATSMEGLQVTNYSSSKIMAHEDVIKFMDQYANDKILTDSTEK